MRGHNRAAAKSGSRKPGRDLDTKLLLHNCLRWANEEGTADLAHGCSYLDRCYSHVLEVLEVDGDGHCGFYASMVGLKKLQLIPESMSVHAFREALYEYYIDSAPDEGGKEARARGQKWRRGLRQATRESKQHPLFRVPMRSRLTKHGGSTPALLSRMFWCTSDVLQLISSMHGVMVWNLVDMAETCGADIMLPCGPGALHGEKLLRRQREHLSSGRVVCVRFEEENEHWNALRRSPDGGAVAARTALHKVRDSALKGGKGMKRRLRKYEKHWKDMEAADKKALLADKKAL